MRDLALDSSSFSHLLNDRSFDAAKIAARLQDRDYRLVLLDDALRETIASASTAAVERRFRNLVDLVEALPEVAVVAANVLGPIIGAEVAGQLHDGVLFLGRIELQRLVDFVRSGEGFAEWHAETREHVIEEMDKDGWFALDETARRDLRSATFADAPRDAKAFVASYRTRVTADLWSLERLAADAAARKRAVADIDGHRALVAAAAMMDLNAYGAVFDLPAGHEFGWLRVERGNWIDALVVANAAYCDVLVTHDRTMRRRVMFLREQGLYRPRPASLSDVLEIAVP